MTSNIKPTDTFSIKVGGKTIATFKQIKVTLPDRAIQVVYRADTSGTTNNFCQYMKGAVNPDWVINDAFQSCVPGGVTKFGSRFVGQPQNNNQANYIADTNGAIGYAEVAYVTDPTRAAKVFAQQIFAMPLEPLWRRLHPGTTRTLLVAFKTKKDSLHSTGSRQQT